MYENIVRHDSLSSFTFQNSQILSKMLKHLVLFNFAEISSKVFENCLGLATASFKLEGCTQNHNFILVLDVHKIVAPF